LGAARRDLNPMPTLLAENIVHFSRILRTAGLQVGPDRVLAAIAAVEAVGLDRKTDVQAALSAVMLDRHEQQLIFDAAFDTFWRDPKLLEQLMVALLPKIAGRGDKHRPPRANRMAEALAPPSAASPKPAADDGKDEVPFETTFSASERELLQRADFEAMTAAEYEWAKALAERAPLPVTAVLRRRHALAPRGRIDLRRTLQGMARQPHTLTPVFTRPERELPPLVVLLDQQLGVREGDVRLGVAWAVWGAGGVAGSAVTPWLARRLGAARTVLLGLPLSAAMAVAAGLAPTFATVVAALAAWGVVVTVVILGTINYRQEVTPEPLQSRVNTTARMLSYGGGWPIGALVAGAVAERTTARAGVLTTAAVLVAGAVAVQFSSLRAVGAGGGVAAET